MPPTLLIIAHGSRRTASNDEVRQLAATLRASKTEAFSDVREAFLELADPSIPDALADCVSLGATEIVVFPYFLAAGTHVSVDIPEEIATFRHKHPHIRVSLTPHLGSSPALGQLILELAGAQESSPHTLPLTLAA